MDTEKIVKSFEDIGQEAYGPDFSGDEVVRELSKAMSTNTQNAGMGDATPLRLENLDGTMTDVLYNESHLKIFSGIPRVTSSQEVYQWNRRLRYGSSRGQVGFRQGGAPGGSTSAWRRDFATVKWLGVRGGYTHQLQITGQMGGMQMDPVAEENRNRTLEFLEKVERATLFADKSILDVSGNDIMYDGFIKQVAAGPSYATIDMEGKPLDFLIFEQIAEQLVTKGKLLNFSDIKTYFTPYVLTDLARLKLDAERIGLNAGQRANLAGYAPGTPLNGFNTQFGFIPFDTSIFLEEVEGSDPLTTGESGAPDRPAGGDIAEAHSGTDGKIPAATYYYGVSAVGDNGESAIRILDAVAVASTEHVTLTITNGSNVTAYRFYRGLSSLGTDFKYVGEKAVGVSTTVFTDTNARRPDTGFMILMNNRPQDIAVAQMAPLIKFPLAVTSTTIEFLLLLYHALVVKAPERMVVVKNIGRRV